MASSTEELNFYLILTATNYYMCVIASGYHIGQ